MKKIYLLSILIVFTLSFCNKNDDADKNIDYKQEMRKFVQGISAYAKSENPNFVIIPQNGHQLATTDGEETGNANTKYLAAIDGVGREDLFYGYKNDDEATPTVDVNSMIVFLDIIKANDVTVLVTDYCSTHSKMDISYQKNTAKGYLSFAASERNLNVIPDYPTIITNENSDDITKLSEAKNFLYLINSEKYANKQNFIDAVSQTNYDVVLIDYAFNEIPFTNTEINSLKTKKNGGKRLVVSYMSIGEAEDYRFYWDSSWLSSKPEWLDKENPDWKGNYKVKYWKPEWQNVIYGNNSSYLKKILNAGFDGIYLDIIDAFEYFEE